MTLHSLLQQQTMMFTLCTGAVLNIILMILLHLLLSGSYEQLNEKQTVHHCLEDQNICYNNDKSQQLVQIPETLHNVTGSGH